MSYRLSVDVIGADELAEGLRKAPSVTRKELSTAIGKTAFKIEASAKAYAPVDRGFLRGSINTRGPMVTANNVEASVGTNLTYAKFQEEGTGIYGPRKQPIRPRAARILAWRRGGQSFFARQVRGVPALRYFQRAREEGRPFLTERMHEALRAIVTALAR